MWNLVLMDKFDSSDGLIFVLFFLENEMAWLDYV